MPTTDHYKNWFSHATNRRITAQDIADQLNISRNAANSRMGKGLTADDIITISRGLGVNPVISLQELGYLTINEILDFMDSDGTLLTNASQEQLVYQLAEDILSASDRIELGRAAMTLQDRSNVVDLQSARADIPLGAVADDSPEEEEGEPGDYDA